MENEFEFDVAFSFTAQDEALATQLNDMLSDRLSTFIYSERQKDLAGTDGQTTFSEVYGKKARIVVVLYREQWGQTRWTGVEMSAIRTRAFEEQWDFTTFIPTEPVPSTPAWFPRTRLYVNLERWGVEGAAAVIEQRVLEAGGKARPESVADRAARLKRANDLKSLQQQFIRTERGYIEGNAAYSELSDALSAGAETITKTGVHMQFREAQVYRIVSCCAVNLICHWQPRFLNSIEDIHLSATYYKGFPELPGFYPSFNKAVTLKTLKLSYGLLRADHAAYTLKSSAREFSPEQLGDFLLSTLMDIAEKNPPS